MSNKKRKNFFMIDNDYVKLYAKHLGIVATAVFTSLNMHADAEGKCFPSMELIGEQHGIDRHTVSRGLMKLEKWKMISVGRAIDRKFRKRKNNVYTLISKEFWKDLPVEDNEPPVFAWNDVENDDVPFAVNGRDKSRGIKSTTYMVSKMPEYGTEDASNKNHIIKPIEENSICEQELAKLPSLLSRKSKLPWVSAVWDSDKAILALVKSDYQDYRIIGEYFYMQKWSFEDKATYQKAFKRSLRAAKALKDYKIEDIRKTMKWMNDKKFDLGWSLEAIAGYIDDCIATDFIEEGEKRIERLNVVNTIETSNQPIEEPKIKAFNNFWNSYPRKADKLSAEEAFKKLDPQIYPKIMESLEQQKKSEQWQKVEYIPLASNWLEKERWNDEVTASTIDPEEAWARECAKKWPTGESDNALFMFTRKYPDQNALKWKSILGL